MNSTPKFVIYAVDQLIKYHDPTPLMHYFESGVPLWQYPESRDLILKLIQQKEIRPEGGGSHAKQEDRDHKLWVALQMVAETQGRGRPVFSNDKANLCQIAARMMGFESARYFFDEYWKKYKDHEQVKRFAEVGRLTAEEEKQSYFNELVQRYLK